MGLSLNPAISLKPIFCSSQKLIEMVETILITLLIVAISWFIIRGESILYEGGKVPEWSWRVIKRCVRKGLGRPQSQDRVSTEEAMFFLLMS